MINPQKVLESADFEVESQDRFAAGPSHDRAIAAAVRAMSAAVNEYVRDVVAGAIAVLEAAPGGAEHANAKLAELQQLVGLTE